MIAIRSMLLALIAALGAPGAAMAQSVEPAALATTAGEEISDGEIRKIDTDNHKVTIKHGPLKNLDMPGMTMVFQVKDPAVLEALQVGEKVRFQAEKIDGKFTVIRIEAQAPGP